MDRDRIERKDFSASRRGYDRDEVDSHLRAVADEVERQRGRAPQEGFADPAADQVRDVLAAAERSAAAIRQRAESDAAEHVARVRGVTERLLSEAASAESELKAALLDLQARGSAQPSDQETESVDVEVVGEQDEELPAGETPDEFEVEDGEPAAQPEADSTPAPAPGDVAAAESPEDEGTPTARAEPEKGGRALSGPEGARLIALNMALNGTPREETARYLSANFDVEDQDAILDDVYQRAG